MATVTDIVTDALFALGAYGQSESLTAEDGALALRRLKRLVDSLANDGLTVYATTDGTFNTVAGTESYSTTGLSAGRPVSIASIFIRESDVDYAVTQITEAQYDAMPYKPAEGLPAYFYYEAGYPNGTIYFYPTPGQVYETHVKGNYPLLSSSITLGTTVSLPPGYEAVLTDALAVDLGPSFGRPVSADLRKSALDALANVKRTNFSPGILATGLPGSGDGYTPGWVRIQGDT
jgi:hypothetical protein